jgi:hypothetical protein
VADGAEERGTPGADGGSADQADRPAPRVPGRSAHMASAVAERACRPPANPPRGVAGHPGPASPKPACATSTRKRPSGDGHLQAALGTRQYRRPQ